MTLDHCPAHQTSHTSCPSCIIAKRKLSKPPVEAKREVVPEPEVIEESAS